MFELLQFCSQFGVGLCHGGPRISVNISAVVGGVRLWLSHVRVGGGLGKHVKSAPTRGMVMVRRLATNIYSNKANRYHRKLLRVYKSVV